MNRFLSYLLVTALSLSVSACAGGDFDGHAPVLGDGDIGDDTGDNNNSDEVVLYDNVVIGDEDPCLVGVEFEEDREDLTFVFTCSPEGRGYDPGAVVVGSHNGGYLRRLETVTIVDQTIFAETSFASLDEVIYQGSMSETLELEFEERNLLNFGGTFLHSGDIGPTNLMVTLPQAHFDIDPKLVIDGHWAWGSMESFDIDMGIDLDMALSVSVRSTNGLRKTGKKDLWTHNWPFAFAIGPVPVAGVVEFKLSAGYSLDAPGQVTVTAGMDADVSAHTRKSWRPETGWNPEDGWNDSSDGSLNFTGPDLDVATRAKVRGYARFDTTVKFYGTVGPRFRAEAGAQVTAEPSCDGIEYDASADMSGQGAITLSILNRFNPSKTFLKITFTADLVEGTIPWPLDLSNFCDPNTIMCGETVTGDTREGTGFLSGYSCNIGSYAAPEIVYQWKATKSGPVTLELVDPDPTSVNHDLMVIRGFPSLAVANCETWGLNSVEFEAEAGATYYLVVDGYDNDSGGFQAQLSCDEADNPFSLDDPSNPF